MIKKKKVINRYLRKLRYWLKFSESNDIRKVFSATSLAYKGLHSEQLYMLEYMR